MATKYPGETAVAYFEVRKVSDDTLVAPSSLEILIKDSTGSTRVNHDDTTLVNPSTGIYRYYFIIPDDVLPGQWHVDIWATVGTYTTFKRVFFEVDE